MNLERHFGWKRGWALRAATIFLIASAWLAAGRAAKAPERAAPRPFATKAASASPSDSYFQVRNYFLDFAGDHSVNAATVTEQASSGYANYTVQLRLASGAEQSVVVAAPPGGLQIEMQDMTGDNVPNDLILRPALPRWPPTVLVNDGHDHFAVVESGRAPGSLSSSEDLGSRPQTAATFACLRSSGFKAIRLPHRVRILAPQFKQNRRAPFTDSFAWGMEHASSSDRAPPSIPSV